MNNIYEILIYNQVSFEQTALILSCFMNISLDLIGTTIEYYNLLNTKDELEIGMKINYFNKGYKSSINIDRMRFVINNYQLVKLACKLAETFETNVAIGDATDSEGFSYLIIDSDGKYQKAHEITKEEENIQFDPYTEKADISKYLKALDDNS